jgi:hypothetical protein
MPAILTSYHRFQPDGVVTPDIGAPTSGAKTSILGFEWTSLDVEILIEIQ